MTSPVVQPCPLIVEPDTAKRNDAISIDHRSPTRLRPQQGGKCVLHHRVQSPLPITTAELRRLSPHRRSPPPARPVPVEDALPPALYLMTPVSINSTFFSQFCLVPVRCGIERRLPRSRRSTTSERARQDDGPQAHVCRASNPRLRCSMRGCQNSNSEHKMHLGKEFPPPLSPPLPLSSPSFFLFADAEHYPRVSSPRSGVTPPYRPPSAISCWSATFLAVFFPRRILLSCSPRAFSRGQRQTQPQATHLEALSFLRCKRHDLNRMTLSSRHSRSLLGFLSPCHFACSPPSLRRRSPPFRLSRRLPTCACRVSRHHLPCLPGHVRPPLPPSWQAPVPISKAVRVAGCCGALVWVLPRRHWSTATRLHFTHLS